MNLSRYISKKTIVHILTGMAIVLSAVVFDAIHEGSEKLADEMQQRSESRFRHSSHIFFYNPVSHFRLKKGADKLFSGLLFAVTQNEFLTQYHNCRAFHLLKAESPGERRPFVRVIHFMDFNPCHHTGADDDPSAL